MDDPYWCFLSLFVGDLVPKCCCGWVWKLEYLGVFIHWYDFLLRLAWSKLSWWRKFLVNFLDSIDAAGKKNESMISSDFLCLYFVRIFMKTSWAFLSLISITKRSFLERFTSKVRITCNKRQTLVIILHSIIFWWWLTNYLSIPLTLFPLVTYYWLEPSMEWQQ